VAPNGSPDPVWRKSRYSAVSGDCVEVSFQADQVLIRDSKDPSGGVLSVSCLGWKGFIEAIKADEIMPSGS